MEKETRGGQVSSSDVPEPEEAPPRLRVKLEHPRGASWALLGLVALMVLIAAAGNWEIFAEAAPLFLFIVLMLLQRTEWKGRPLTPAAFGPSVFDEGLRVLPRDVLALSFLALSIVPTVLLVTLVWEMTWLGWVSVGWSAVVSTGALIALAIELLRRRAGQD